MNLKLQTSRWIAAPFAALVFAVAGALVAAVLTAPTATSAAPEGAGQRNGQGASEGTSLTEVHSKKAQRRVAKPGQIGRAKVGMSVRDAMATDEFNKNVPNPPCGTLKLQPKGSWKKQYLVFATGRIKEMDAFGNRVRTSHGLGVGSTVREVRKVYGDKVSAPRKAGYGQWALFVKKQDGKATRWLGFLFGDAYTADGPLKPRDKVTLLGVTKNVRPSLMVDGC